MLLQIYASKEPLFTTSKTDYCPFPIHDDMKTSAFKTAVRLAFCLFAIGAFLLLAHLQDLGDQYGVLDYFTFSVSNLRHSRFYHSKPVGNIVGDKVIVMAKMEHEDTSWVAEELPEYVPLSAVRLVTNSC